MPASIKVCYVAPDLGNGGAQKQLIELIANLSRPEFEPVVVNLWDKYTSDRLKHLGIRVIDLEYRGGLDLGKVFRINRTIAREKPDILHCVLTSANFYGLLASIGTRVPVRIAGERSVGTRFQGLRRAAYAKVLAMANAVITNSRRNKEWMESAYSMPAGAVKVIHNGCKLPTPSPAPVLEERRRSLGLRSGELVIATLTHLTPEKDVECLARAAARLAAGRTDFRVVVAGEGPCLDAVREIMTAHRLDGRMLLAGQLPHSDAMVVAQLCDVFALPSRFEGMPNALMEAMSFGRACVATNVGGIPELIEPEVTGLRFESGDDQTLAIHLDRLLSDSELRRRLGQNARARIAAEFSIEKMVRTHEDLYRSLAGKARSSHPSAERLAG